MVPFLTQKSSVPNCFVDVQALEANLENKPSDVFARKLNQEGKSGRIKQGFENLREWEVIKAL